MGFLTRDEPVEVGPDGMEGVERHDLTGQLRGSEQVGEVAGLVVLGVGLDRVQDLPVMPGHEQQVDAPPVSPACSAAALASTATAVSRIELLSGPISMSAPMTVAPAPPGLATRPRRCRPGPDEGAAHLIGGAGLIVANRDRVKDQAGAGRNTVVKTALTGEALAATAYSGVLGARIAAADGSTAEGATEPSRLTDPDVAAAQKRLKTVQWIIPAVTGAILVLGAEQGEQQKPEEQARGFAAKRLNSFMSR